MVCVFWGEGGAWFLKKRSFISLIFKEKNNTAHCHMAYAQCGRTRVSLINHPGNVEFKKLFISALTRQHFIIGSRRYHSNTTAIFPYE